MLGAPAREVASTKRDVDDVQAKRFVRSVPVKRNSGPRKTLEEALTAVIAAYCSVSGFSGSSNDVPIVEDEIFEEDVPWNLRDFRSKNNRGLSASQRVQALC